MDNGGKKGKGLPRNMYECPMDIENSVGIDCGSQGGMGGGGKREKNLDKCNRIIKKMIKNK